MRLGEFLVKKTKSISQNTNTGKFLEGVRWMNVRYYMKRSRVPELSCDSGHVQCISVWIS